MPAREPWLGQTRHSWPASSSLPRESLMQDPDSSPASSPHTNDWLLQLVPCSRVVTQPVSSPAARRGESGASDDDPSLSRHLLHSSAQRGTRAWLSAEQGRKAPELLSLRLKDKASHVSQKRTWKTGSWGPDWLIPGDGDHIKICAFIRYLQCFIKTTEHNRLTGSPKNNS